MLSMGAANQRPEHSRDTKAVLFRRHRDKNPLMGNFGSSTPWRPFQEHFLVELHHFHPVSVLPSCLASRSDLNCGLRAPSLHLLCHSWCHMPITISKRLPFWCLPCSGCGLTLVPDMMGEFSHPLRGAGRKGIKAGGLLLTWQAWCFVPAHSTPFCLCCEGDGMPLFYRKGNWGSESLRLLPSSWIWNQTQVYSTLMFFPLLSVMKRSIAGLIPSFFASFKH